MFQLPQIGRVAAGYDADLVVLSGPPFDPSSQVLAVMIDGQWVYRRGNRP
jgi:imidazolonepropionase-like amidohydrolase